MSGAQPPAPAVAGTRMPEIDVARGLAMVLVVLGHNGLLAGQYPFVIKWLFLFHVPAFFLISGYLIRPGRPARISGLARRLLLPALLVALGLLLAKLALRGGDPVAGLDGVLWATGPTLPSSQLWFLPVLFLALALLPRLAELCASKPIAALLLPALGLLGWAGLQLPALPFAEALRVPGVAGPIGWPWGLDLLPIAMAYGLAGHLVARGRGKAPWPLWWLPLGLALTLAAAASGVRSDLNMRLMQPYLPGLLSGLAGALAVLALGRLLAQIRPLSAVLRVIGQRSLSILFFHVLIQNAAIVLIRMILPGGCPGAGWLALLAGLAGPVALSVLWEKRSLLKWSKRT